MTDGSSVRRRRRRVAYVTATMLGVLALVGGVGGFVSPAYAQGPWSALPGSCASTDNNFYNGTPSNDYPVARFRVPGGSIASVLVAMPFVVSAVTRPMVPPFAMKVTTVPSGTIFPDESLTVALRRMVPGQVMIELGVASRLIVTGTPVAIGVLVSVGVTVGVSVGISVAVGIGVSGLFLTGVIAGIAVYAMRAGIDDRDAG